MTDIQLNVQLISKLGRVLFMSTNEMIAATNIATSTWYYIMQKPSEITIQQLLAISNGLHIPIRLFFSKEGTDIIGRHEDYIKEPYIPCYYNSDKLQKIVMTHSDATWKKASKASGVSPTRLKNSLIGATRTPVNRFLTVCKAFNLDPFSILTDPNQEIENNKHSLNHQKHPKETDYKTIQAEITDLHNKIAHLNNIVNDLMTNYKKLLTEHERLEKRVNVGLQAMNNSYPYMVSETEPRQEK